MSVPSRCSDHRRAIAVRDHLAAGISEPATLRRVSRELGISESTIRRSLVAIWGIGFHATLERLRVQQVLWMLADDGNTKVEALALTVGWRGRANLYAAVRRVTGCSLTNLRSNRVRLEAAIRQVAAIAPMSVDIPVDGSTHVSP